MPGVKIFRGFAWLARRVFCRELRIPEPQRQRACPLETIFLLARTAPLRERHFMKVVAWNMDHWKHRPVAQGAWKYLDSVIQPDIALLQESSPPMERLNPFCVFHEIGEKRRWGSAVLTNNIQVQEFNLDKNSFPGALVVAKVELPQSSPLKVPLFAVSMYGLWDKYRAIIPTLHVMLSELTHLINGKLHDDNRPAIILGGDLNASPQWDDTHGTKTHRNFFDRLAALGFVDCQGEFNANRPQTHRHNRSKYPWVFDFVFATENLKKFIGPTEVKDDPEANKFSDHNPVVVTFKF